ncbi:MAG: ABC transporter permease [Lachnospiraceae bacterium]|nr:ABC transporter permease [Lachnospiraceae bacterium]
MDFLLRYIKLEFKRILKAFPKMLLGAVILAFIIGTLAYGSSKLLYANKDHDKVKVAMAIEDDSKLISMATTLLQSSESISYVANFVRVKPETADKLIDGEDFIASITIPEGFINGLMTGKHVSIDIKFSKNMHAFTGIFKELSLTATKTMVSAQAGIYAQSDFYKAHNKTDNLSDANEELNKKYLSFIFSRDSIFDSEVVSSTGNVRMLTYYLAGGLVLFFMMFSMAFSSFIMNDGIILKNKLFSSPVGIYGYYLSKILIIFSMYYVIYILIGLCTIFLNLNIFKIWAIVIPVLLCLASIMVLFFEIAPNKLTSIILIFVFSTASAILSGCLIPVSYLPKTLGLIGTILPSTPMIKAVAYGLEAGVDLVSIVRLICISVICYFGTIIFVRKVRSCS